MPAALSAFYLFINPGAYDANLVPRGFGHHRQSHTYGSSLRVQKLRGSRDREIPRQATSLLTSRRSDGDTARLSDHVGRGPLHSRRLQGPAGAVLHPRDETTSSASTTLIRHHSRCSALARVDEPKTPQGHQGPQSAPGARYSTQNVATTCLRYSAIPCIILFDPEGNIVSARPHGEAEREGCGRYLAPAKQ